MQRNTKVLNIITITCMLCFSIPSLLIMLRPCTDFKDYELDVYLDTGIIVVFAILGIIFFICGLTMNLALRSYFPHFYNIYRGWLWVACFSLSTPLLLRSITNILYKYSPVFQKWYDDEFVLSNNTFLVVTTYIPILTSMSSLIFGYLRKRQEKMVKNEQDKDAYMALGMHGGSGELAVKQSETSSSGTGITSEVRSYLDPPIENYRHIYSGKIKSPNGSSCSVSPQNSSRNFF